MPRRAVHGRQEPSRLRRGRLAGLRTAVARCWVALLTGTLAAYGISEMYGVLSTTSITPLQWGFLFLFAVNFSWIAFAMAQASLGFLSGIVPLPFNPPERPGGLPFRTAVLLPVYNEDPRRIAAAVRIMRDGLAREASGRFAFFILSDSTEVDHWLDEEAVVRELVLESTPACPVYYRHRPDNRERKAGNLAEWVQRWGGAYEAMLVLDADSIMAPETMIRLARRLAADPGLGLIQTLPAIVRAQSLYGRLQQFAGQCYGPVYGRGLAAWHGCSSNYWGHNAIIRTRAFADACGLPILSGRAPRGGHIMSHDFIEAALLRRAGWGVRFDPDLKHSYEEAPPSLIDVIVRDRRWCQGNLQHIRFLLARGLTPSSRIHLLSGIMSYLSAVFWLALVLLGLAIALQATLTRPEYFAEPGLFPTWPVFDAERARWLFGVSMAVLLAPKWFGATLALIHPRRLFGFGGPVLLPLNLMLEIVFSALFAPVLMLAQNRAVWSFFRGLDTGWRPQSRENGSVSIVSVCRMHWVDTGIGIALSTSAWFINQELFLWLLPITAGLVLSIPLSWLSGIPGNNVLKRVGVLRTPGERKPCNELRRLEEELSVARETPSRSRGLLRLAQDRDLRHWHLAQLAPTVPERPPARVDTARITGRWKAENTGCLTDLHDWLSDSEELALLSDRDELRTLLSERR